MSAGRAPLPARWTVESADISDKLCLGRREQASPRILRDKEYITQCQNAKRGSWICKSIGYIF